MSRAMIYAAGTFFPRICALLSVFLFSHLLPVKEFGLYALVITVGEFCDFVSSVWIRTGFLRFYHLSKDDPVENLTPMILANLACTCIGVLLVWVVAQPLTRSEWLPFAIVCSLYVIGNGTVQTALNIFRGEGRALAFGLVESLRPIAMVSAGLLAISVWRPSFIACAFAVFSLHCAVGVAVLARVWSLRSGGNDTRGRVRAMAAYAWPLWIAALSTASMTFADRYQLQWFLGPSAVALYAAAFTIGRQPLDVLYTAVNQGSFTELMKVYDREGPDSAARHLGRQIVTLTALGGPAAVGLAILARPVVHILFDERYWADAPKLVPIIATTAFCAGLRSYGFDQAFHMARKTLFQVATQVPAVVAGVVGGILLVHSLGILGAAYGALIGFAGSLVLSIIFSRRVLRIQVPWVEIIKVAIATSAMAIGVMSVQRLAGPSLGGLIASILFGVAIYATIALAFNLLGLRDLALNRFILRHRFE